jgi:hypothetical protein
VELCSTPTKTNWDEENVEQVLPRISRFSCYSSTFMNDIFDNKEPQYLKKLKLAATAIIIEYERRDVINKHFRKPTLSSYSIQ